MSQKGFIICSSLHKNKTVTGLLERHISHDSLCAGLFAVGCNYSVCPPTFGQECFGTEHYGGITSWLTDKNAEECFGDKKEVFKVKRRNKHVKNCQPHQHAHTHEGFTQWDTHRRTVCCDNKQSAACGVRRRLEKQLSLCENTLLLFVQSGHFPTPETRAESRDLPDNISILCGVF